MKQDIHPSYHKAKVTCACGNSFTVGSAKEHLEVEICSNCHPFYTGGTKLVDTAGRVERFKARLRVTEARSGEAKARLAKKRK